MDPVGTVKAVVGLPEPWNWIVGISLSVIGLGVLLYRMMKFVKRDKIAIIERLGKPILKYNPLPGDTAPLTPEIRKQRMAIDEKLIAVQENPIYGEPVMRPSGAIILNPFTQRIEEVEARERNITIEGFPLVVALTNFDGFTISLGVTVKMENAYRWRYRNEAVDDLIKFILLDCLSAIRDDKGAAWIRDNPTEFTAYYLEILQTQDRKLTRLGSLDDELQLLLLAHIKADPLKGVLAKYGGYASNVYLLQTQEIYEGWQPQAVQQVAKAFNSPASELLPELDTERHKLAASVTLLNAKR
jgi:hypothetical protein